MNRFSQFAAPIILPGGQMIRRRLRNTVRPINNSL